MIAFLRNLVVNDFWLKLFSLVLAILIWFTVSFLAPAEQQTFSNVPVVIVSSGDDVHSFRVNPGQAEVTVQGDAKTLRNLQTKDLRVLVDLTGIETAHNLRKRIEVATPAGITLVRVDPEEVQVIFPPKP